MSKERSTDTYESLSAVLKALRAARGMSQAALADASGVSATLIALIETDKRRPSSKNLDNLAVALRLTQAEMRKLRDAYARNVQTLGSRSGAPPPSGQGLTINEIQAIAVRLNGLAANQHDVREQLAEIRDQLALPAGISGTEAISERLRETLEVNDGLEGRLHELADVFSAISEQLDAIGQRLSTQFS